MQAKVGNSDGSNYNPQIIASTLKQFRSINTGDLLMLGSSAAGSPEGDKPFLIGSDLQPAPSETGDSLSPSTCPLSRLI